MYISKGKATLIAPEFKAEDYKIQQDDTIQTVLNVNIPEDKVQELISVLTVAMQEEGQFTPVMSQEPPKKTRGRKNIVDTYKESISCEEE